VRSRADRGDARAGNRCAAGVCHRAGDVSGNDLCFRGNRHEQACEDKTKCRCVKASEHGATPYESCFRILFSPGDLSTNNLETDGPNYVTFETWEYAGSLTGKL